MSGRLLASSRVIKRLSLLDVYIFVILPPLRGGQHEVVYKLYLGLIEMLITLDIKVYETGDRGSNNMAEFAEYCRSTLLRKGGFPSD